MRKCKKNSLCKPLCLIILGLLMINLMAVSLVNAFEFDNTKTYNIEEREITVTNAFGLGDEISKIKLNTPLTYNVIYGEDRLVAEFTIDNKEEYGDVFNEMDFYNLNGNFRKINKEFNYKYKEFHNEDYTWKELDTTKELPPGIITIGVFTDVEVGEYIEWIPTLFGVRIDEWASWQEGFNTNILSYYKLNETIGAVIDSTGLHNGVNNDATRGVAGKINNSFDFEAGDATDNVSIGQIDLVQNFTINAWINKESTGVNNHIISGPTTGVELRIDTADNIKFGESGVSQVASTGTVAGTGAWHMVTVSYNGTYANFYIDGTFDSAVAFTNSLSTGVEYFIGKGGAGEVYDGLIDELGIWNRTMTTTEVTDLWNGGDGVTYINLFPPTITLNVPVAYYNSTNNSVIFNCSASDSSQVLNLTLVIDNVDNFTVYNTTANQLNLSLQTTLNVSNGNHNWTCRGENLDEIPGTIIGRLISIETEPPEIAILYPIGQVESFVTGDNLDLNWSINDTTLDSCWYEYNSINTSLTCGDNTTTFTPIANINNLRVYANDSLGNISFSDTTWTYAFIEESVDFNTDVYETASEDFKLNLTTDIEVLTIDSFLIYNGVSDRSTASCTTDGNCTLMNTIDIPLVSDANETENKTFFWSITIFNGTDSISINTSERQQNVSKIHLTTCDATYTTLALNFTAFDEQNLSLIDPFLYDGDFSTWLGSGSVKRSNNVSAGNVSSAALCLSPNDTHYIDGQVTYDYPLPAVYTERNYWFQNDTISNVSENIDLGLLLASSSTSFILKVQDTNILPVADVIIYTERFYPGLGEFKIVQVAKTDDNGGSVGFFEAETGDYRFILKQQGTIVLQTNEQKIVGESAPFTLTFTIGDAQGTAWEDFEDNDDLEQSLTFNSSSNVVTFVYTDTSGDFTSGNLVVERLMSNGSSNVVICNTTSYQSSATILCDITGNESGTYSAQGRIIRTSETIIGQILVQVLFGTEDFTDIAGDYGLFLGWFVIIVACFAFKFNEIAGIFMINVAVVGVNIIGLIHFGPVFITAMVGLSIFIAVVLER